MEAELGKVPGRTNAGMGTGMCGHTAPVVAAGGVDVRREDSSEVVLGMAVSLLGAVELGHSERSGS